MVMMTQIVRKRVNSYAGTGAYYTTISDFRKFSGIWQSSADCIMLKKDAVDYHECILNFKIITIR